MKIKTQQSKICGTNQSGSQREVDSNIGPPQETRKISRQQCNITPKGLEKEQSPKLVQGRK